MLVKGGDLSLKHARTQGFFKSRNIRIALDTTPIFGRGAVEDTYNMLAEALRLLISALGAFAHESAEEFTTHHDLKRYVMAKSFKGSFESIDWDNPDERQSVLDCLVADCERTLLLAREALTDSTQESLESAQIVKVSTLLRRLLPQDVERTNTGAANITQGVAQDRIVSVHDTEHSEVRCPAGELTQTYSRRTEKRHTGRAFAYRSYRFAPKQCGACALRSQCLKQTTPYRSVLVHEHEGLVNEAKAFQRTDIFRTIYRTRVAVEHRIARLMRFGARKARYFGSSKVLFQLAF